LRWSWGRQVREGVAGDRLLATARFERVVVLIGL
jgi:hypothetical protein